MTAAEVRILLKWRARLDAAMTEALAELREIGADPDELLKSLERLHEQRDSEAGS